MPVSDETLQEDLRQRCAKASLVIRTAERAIHDQEGWEVVPNGSTLASAPLTVSVEDSGLILFVGPKLVVAGGTLVDIRHRGESMIFTEVQGDRDGSRHLTWKIDLSIT